MTRAITPILSLLATLLAAAPASAEGVAHAELRAEAAIVTSEIRVRDVLRWPAADAAYFTPVEDVVVARMAPGQKSLHLDLPLLLKVLEGAGLSQGELMLHGATASDIHRLDADSPAARREPPHPASDIPLDQFITQHAGPATPPSPQTAQLPTLNTQYPIPNTPPFPPAQSATLKDAIYREVINRTGHPREDIEIAFDAADERVLSLAEPQCRFSLTRSRQRGYGGLGSVTWSVVITADGQSRAVDVTAVIRLWQTQVVAPSGLEAGEVIRPTDLAEKRILVERVSEEALMGRDALRGMEARQPIAPNTPVTSRMVKRVMLVRQGQIVAVTYAQGGFEVRSVARAEQNGFFGQGIRVVNEQTRQLLNVTVIGSGECRAGATPEPASADDEEKLP